LVLECSAIGGPDTVADEPMLSSTVYNPAARLQSYEIAAKVRD
jgi:hypothetical protein